ncbi:uncharacterized protein LOC142341125 [Convolutriloba macropyga]|uniref:uncharacterized protein LOC142341125 n=1 Tax=Convolutriloba macropyga TaxID=536237 RepID=UPI003F526DD2
MYFVLHAAGILFMAHMVAGGTLHPSWTQLKPVEDIGLYCEHIFRLDILQACEAGVFFLKQFSLQLEVNSNEKNWIKGVLDACLSVIMSNYSSNLLETKRCVNKAAIDFAKKDKTIDHSSRGFGRGYCINGCGLSATSVTEFEGCENNCTLRYSVLKADGGPLTDFYDSYVDYVPKLIVAQSHGRK